MNGCKNCGEDDCVWRGDEYIDCELRLAYERIDELESKLLSSKADIVKEFVEDLEQVIMRIMYCNNKEIGQYVLASQLFHEIDCLLAEVESEE